MMQFNLREIISVQIRFKNVILLQKIIPCLPKSRKFPSTNTAKKEIYSTIATFNIKRETIYITIEHLHESQIRSSTISIPASQSY